MKQARISRGGQVSIPAAVRHRWNTDRILVDDRGDELVMRPLPGDPIQAARGSLKRFATGDAISSDEALRRTRDEEAATDRGRPR
jgi:bifunctional DNA-binding transcriptional regulator/antitoxin component of YhaV-PrlF toxin-antitoxin module